MPEICQLQSGAGEVREPEHLRVAIAAGIKNQPSYRIGGIRTVIQHIAHSRIAGHCLVLAKSHQQVGEGLLRNVAGVDRLGQRDEYRVASLTPIAGVQFPAPQIQQRQGLLAIADLIAQVVGDAAVGIDAVEMGPQPWRQKPRGHVEIFVVRGGQPPAVGTGLLQGRALLRHAVFRGQSGPAAFYQFPFVLSTFDRHLDSVSCTTTVPRRLVRYIYDMALQLAGRTLCTTGTALAVPSSRDPEL